MSNDKKGASEVSKLGRKGGTVFPRIALGDALPYAKKLVSKTHTGPQPQDVILSGVVGSKHGVGRIRMSALKQFGLLKGDPKSGYSATDLAKKIVAAPADESVPLLREAALRPAVFRGLFNTYHGDSVTTAKLKQRASDLNVHPDETERCADLYVSTLTASQLATIDGELVNHLALADISGNSEVAGPEIAPQDAIAETQSPNEAGDEHGEPHAVGSPPVTSPADSQTNSINQTIPFEDAQPRPRAVFNVNVTLDSSLDTDKLQKQLEMLKRYGAI